MINNNAMSEKWHKIDKFANYQNKIVRNNPVFDRHVFVPSQNHWSLGFYIIHMISAQFCCQDLLWSFCKLWEHCLDFIYETAWEFRSMPPPPSCIIELFSLFHNGLITKKCKFKLLYVVRSKGCGTKNAAGCPVPIFSYFSYFLSLFLFSPIFILKPPICPIFYLVKPKFVTKLKMEL